MHRSKVNGYKQTNTQTQCLYPLTRRRLPDIWIPIIPETIARPSQVYNGDPYTNKTVFFVNRGRCLSHRMTSQWCNYGNHRFIIIGHPCRFVKFYQYPRYQIKKNNNMIWNVRKYIFHQLNEHLWMFNLICIKQAGTFGCMGFHCDVIKGM